MKAGLLLSCAGAALLAGCASMAYGPSYATVELGTRIRFGEPLTAGQYGVIWFQDGEKMGFYELERRDMRPYCKFRTGLQAGDSVPRRWTVTGFRVEQQDTNRISTRFGLSLRSEVPILEYRSFMTLMRDGRKAWLICSQEYDAGFSRYVHADEIPAILGHGATFTPPAPGSDPT